MMMLAVAVMSASVKLPSAFASAFFRLNDTEGCPALALTSSTMSAIGNRITISSHSYRIGIYNGQRTLLITDVIVLGCCTADDDVVGARF